MIEMLYTIFGTETQDLIKKCWQRLKNIQNRPKEYI